MAFVKQHGKPLQWIPAEILKPALQKQQEAQHKAEADRKAKENEK